MAADAETLDKIRRLLRAADGISGPTFREVWIPYYRQEGRYRRSAKRIEQHGEHLLAAWKDRPALRCDVAAAEEYRDARKASKTYKGAPPRPATVNRELACARRALQWAILQRPQLIPHNPLAAVILEEEHNVRQIGHKSEEDLQALLASADPEEKAAILLYVDCGPRRMEVLSLQWAQLLMAKVKVAGALKNRPVIHLWDTKNADPRRFGITWRTYEALQALPRHGRYVFPGRQPGRYRSLEAPVRPGTHLTPDAFLKRFKRLCVRAGVFGPDGKALTIHDLRHWFIQTASIVYRIPRRSVMKQTGHKTDSAYDRYGIGGEEETALMYEAVDAAIESEMERIRKK